ncbi:MAG: fibro-slime domain-containing protein, partial [Chitinivibrionales bacterium]|nr:fibro-slime domain-containing protein [Chitinivibrionales bacterium]
MIQDTLTPHTGVWNKRKPVFRADRACNDMIEHWYVPSGSNSSVNFYFDNVDSMWKWSGLVQSSIDPDFWVGPEWQDDPPDKMTNLVLYDSLPFLLEDSATGTYSFTRSGSNQFFWLDDKGFGNEPTGRNPPHNFAFTMEMHHEFTYKGGEFFDFSGDDDVWVFINNHLVIDLGGVHSSASDNISLDALATTLGLQTGRRYWFDFFYAERHTSQANCVITTNILTPTKPNDIIITFDPDPPDPENPPPDITDLTMTAGQCTTLHTWVIDDTGGLRPDWDTLVNWVVVDTIGNEVTYDTVSGDNEIC